jgi:hypothetical protein
MSIKKGNNEKVIKLTDINLICILALKKSDENRNFNKWHKNIGYKLRGIQFNAKILN